MEKSKYQPGYRHGDIEVIRRISTETYECKCHGCGKVYTVNISNLGKRSRCRDCYLASRKKDLTGQRFGRLTAMYQTKKKRGNRMLTAWVCDCDCGNHPTVFADLLLNGGTKSCGCLLLDRDIPEKIKREFVAGTQISKIQSKPTKSNKTGIVGVNWDKSRNKWQASIRFQGKKIALGRFDEFQDAVDARKAAEEKYFKKVLDIYEDQETKKEAPD